MNQPVKILMLLFSLLALILYLGAKPGQIEFIVNSTRVIQKPAINSTYPTHLNSYISPSTNLWLRVNGLIKENNFQDSVKEASKKQMVTDAHGAIIRGDISRKELALVFTGDEFADGGQIIRHTLHKHKIKAGFFLTGNFYSNPTFIPLIKSLRLDGHYMGAHSDKHLLYADWTKRDSLFVNRQEFRRDLKNNYTRMASLGIKKEEAPYFLPPFEWYNSTIARWTRELNLQLINFSPGTLSTADYTYPEMGNRYRNSDEIYQSIMQYESSNTNGLNGFILLSHIGTDPRRTDKFYTKLDDLLEELKTKGYRFVRINKLLE